MILRKFRVLTHALPAMISLVLLKTVNCLYVAAAPPSSLSSQFRISIFDFQFFDPCCPKPSHPLSLTVSPRRCRVRLLGPNPALPDRRRNVCLSAEPFGPWLSWCVSQLPSPSRLRGIISTSTPSK